MKKLLVAAFMSALVDSGARADVLDSELTTGRRWMETKGDDGKIGQQINEITLSTQYLKLGFGIGPYLNYRSTHMKR